MILYSRFLSYMPTRWDSSSFWMRATCLVSRLMDSTLSLCWASWRSILAILCVNWWSFSKLVSASYSYSFLNFSLIWFGSITPIMSDLALIFSISLLASSIYRKMLRCSLWTPSTLSWSSRTFVGFISYNILWKSSPIFKFVSTVFILCNSRTAWSLLFNSFEIWLCMTFSYASQVLTLP